MRFSFSFLRRDYSVVLQKPICFQTSWLPKLQNEGKCPLHTSNARFFFNKQRWQGSWKLPDQVCHIRTENKVNTADSFIVKEVVFMTLRNTRNGQPFSTLYHLLSILCYISNLLLDGTQKDLRIILHIRHNPTESEIQTKKQPGAFLYHQRSRKRSKERWQTTRFAQQRGQNRGEKHQKQPQASERKAQVSGRKPVR